MLLKTRLFTPPVATPLPISLNTQFFITELFEEFFDIFRNLNLFGKPAQKTEVEQTDISLLIKEGLVRSDSDSKTLFLNNFVNYEQMSRNEIRIKNDNEDGPQFILRCVCPYTGCSSQQCSTPASDEGRISCEGECSGNQCGGGSCRWEFYRVVNV